MAIKNFSDVIPCHLFMDCLPGLSYIYNKEGELVAWSSSKTWDILGYSDEELHNKHILEFIPEDEREGVQKAMSTVFEKGGVVLEHNALAKDGTLKPALASAVRMEINGEEYLAGLTIDISELAEARVKIKDQVKEINKLNEFLTDKNIYLQEKIELCGSHSNIIGVSESITYILYKAEQVAPTDAPVLLLGETGAGKEMIAEFIHNNSDRKDKLFVQVNCASIPENLIETELFGHVRGAYTGAVGDRKGRFEMAEGGTLFLDEVGELPLHIQSKLLHVLHDGKYEKVGSSVTINSDVRIIAATNRVLTDEVSKGNFRKDLFYRINVFPITVSPLRQRKEDIIPLTNFFIKKYSSRFNIPIEVIPKETYTMLENYNWPGNIRELENIIERGVISSRDKILNVEKLEDSSDGTQADQLSLHDHEKKYILEILESTNWKISGKGGAADKLDVNHQTLRSKIKKLGIERPSL